MEEDIKKEIVDSYGNTINSTNEIKKIQEIINKNIWNIFWAVVVIKNFFNIFTIEDYANSCSLYYGISKRYFNSTDMFKAKFIFFIAAIVLIMYPFILDRINKKIKSNFFIWVSFIFTILVLLMQNLNYAINFIDILKWGWLKIVLDNYFTIGLFLIVDIILAYFFILRNRIKKIKKYTRMEKIIFTMAMSIYLIEVSLGIWLVLASDISDKKIYEVIKSDNKVIVEEYNGRFIIMNCEINDDKLLIEKAKYSFIDITGVEITYCKYKDVECK